MKDINDHDNYWDMVIEARNKLLKEFDIINVEDVPILVRADWYEEHNYPHLANSLRIHKGESK